METKKLSTKKYSVQIRLWHWLNALVICGSLLTVLINSTLLDVKDNGAYIKDELAKVGAAVTVEQARSAAHGLEDKVWDIHIYFGYALAALFLFRLLVELFKKNGVGFIKQLQLTYKTYLTHKIAINRYELLVKLLYALFYVVFIIMIITGLLVAFKTELSLVKSFSHDLKEIHGFCMYIIIAFAVIHIFGVYLGERKAKKGILSDMINGGNLEF